MNLARALFRCTKNELVKVISKYELDTQSELTLSLVDEEDGFVEGPTVDVMKLIGACAGQVELDEAWTYEC